MANYKQLFMEHMDAKNVRYEDVDERVVKIGFSADNMKSIQIFVFFDEDNGPHTGLKCMGIGSFKNKEAEALVACNEANKQYRWVKFYADDDFEIVASADAILSGDSCGSECLEMVLRMVNIVDETYPTFMKALWG